jgi:hypothetical protein
MFRKLAQKIGFIKNREWLDDQDFEGVRCLICRTVFEGTAEEAVTAFLQHPCKSKVN